MTKPSLTNYLKQDCKTLGRLLSKLSQLEHWNNALRECLITEPTLTEHCKIVNLIGTSLIAIADSPHWLTRIRFHIPELLPKLRTYPGLEQIRALCCKVQPNYPKMQARQSNRAQKKLSPNNAQLLHQDAQKISDEKLRTVMEKIARHFQDSDAK